MLSHAILPSSLLLSLAAVFTASPIYPGYRDFGPGILPGGYGAGPYPFVPGGGYYGSHGHHHHSAGGRYSGQEGYSEKSVEYQKDSKYYYGGQYKGSCLEDGLYYKDDTTFVMCSNGYPHEQPCPPGTKTSGSPSYKAGYYYGYTDLCSVNLVDYGLGPEHYAPAGLPELEKTSHHSRDGSSVRKVSYSSSGHVGPHGEEKHVSKDVYSEKDRVGHYGAQHQRQHIHVEKHKVHNDHAQGYNKDVVKQASVTSYDEVSQGHNPGHYGYPANGYPGNGHYGGAEHGSSNHYVHKEKERTVGYQAAGSPFQRQEHSELTVKPRDDGAGYHHHQAGRVVEHREVAGGYGGRYPAVEKVKETVNSYQGAGPHGAVEGYQSSRRAYSQYGGGHYPEGSTSGHHPYGY